jgi:hypothetical protein
MIFEVLIDDLFLNVIAPETAEGCDKKHVLSIINDFEGGAWRYQRFQSFIWDNVAQTSLSQSERESLVGRSHTELVAAAQNLRLTDADDDVGTGSELAEIVLYGLMRHHYKALPVVPKIFYKQNTQDNAKGADSVHIVIEEGTEEFTIWLGEAKFYSSIEDVRLMSIVNSIKTSLEVAKLRKENRIITNVSDLDLLPMSGAVRRQIKQTLSDDTSLDEIKPKLHVPILLLHQCDITKTHSELTDDYKRRITEYHKVRAASYFSKQVQHLKSIHKYSAITFHIILFPVPCKETVVTSFIANVNHYKSQ